MRRELHGSEEKELKGWHCSPRTACVATTAAARVKGSERLGDPAGLQAPSFARQTTGAANPGLAPQRPLIARREDAVPSVRLRA